MPKKKIAQKRSKRPATRATAPTAAAKPTIEELRSDARYAVGRLYGAVTPQVFRADEMIDRTFIAFRIANFAIKAMAEGDAAATQAMDEILERLDRSIFGEPLVQAADYVDSFSRIVRKAQSNDDALYEAQNCLLHLRSLDLGFGIDLAAVSKERALAILTDTGAGRRGAKPSGRALLSRLLAGDDDELRSTIDRAIKKARERRSKE